MCLGLHLQELKQAISSIPSPCTSQIPSQQNNTQCSTSLHTQSNSINSSAKEPLFLRNWIPCLCRAFLSAEISRLLFISICLGSKQFPSSPQSPSFTEFWNSLDSEKHDWKRSFGQDMPQSKRGQWQTQRSARIITWWTSQNGWKWPMQENNGTSKSWNSTTNTNRRLTHTGLYWILGGNVHTAAVAQCSTTLLYFTLICWYRREERELILPAGLNELYLTRILL